MSANTDDQIAFAQIESALVHGYPIRPRDVLIGIPSARVAHLTRTFAGEGRGRYARWGNSDWIVPLDARMDLEEFAFIQSPQMLSALGFVKVQRIFTQKSLFAFIAGEGPVTGTVRKMAARLWHMDLVAYRSEADGIKYFEVTPKGTRLFSEAAAYRVPSFSDKQDRADLSKFHAVLDLEAVRNP